MGSYFRAASTVWTATNKITTLLVRLPELISAQCVTRGECTCLEITINANSSDPRADHIPGDIIVFGKPDPL